MACLTDGMLRAHLDGELSEAQAVELKQHCADCAECRGRAEAIAQGAQRVQSALSSLQPTEGEAESDARAALAGFRSKLAIAEQRPSSLAAAVLSKPRAWAALAVVGLAICLLTFAPARSWAQRLVGLLRVQRITAVSIDLDAFEGRGDRRHVLKTMAELMSDDVVVTIKPGEPQTVATREEASQTAGFAVRLPQKRGDAPKLRVLGQQAFHATIDRDRLQAVLDEAGRSDLQLPFALDGATIAAHLPNVAIAEYGHCPGRANDDRPRPQLDEPGCVELVQAPSPSVTVPPELNLGELAEVALQLSGMSAEAARGFSRSVDWTSTMVLGLPRGTSWRSVEVDGVQGTLIERSARRGRPPGYSLLWVKNGIIYALTGFGEPAEALTLAGSLN